MASTTLNYHPDADETLPVKCRTHDTEPGDLWVTIGRYPNEITLFLSQRQAETLAYTVLNALREADTGEMFTLSSVTD